MNGLRAATVAMVGLLASGQAGATRYLLEARGVVSSTLLSSGAGGGGYSPISGGRFAVGDTFAMRSVFDTDLASGFGVPDVDPTVSIRYLVGSVTSVESGSYFSGWTSSFISSSVQLGNDRTAPGIAVPYDSQSFEFSNYDFRSEPPFDIGGGLNAELVSLSSFDFSGRARSTDGLDELVPSSRFFGSNTLSYSYSSGQDPLSGPRPAVLALIGGVTWTLNPEATAVPEPATWMLLLIGFALIGSALRRRRAASTAVSHDVGASARS